jgi:ABC-type glycerol-3-phosphate transport system substrate-binding protein
LKQSQHPDLAVEWVKMLIRADVQDLVYPALGRLPSTRSALSKLRTTVTPAMYPFIDDLLQTPDIGIIPQWRAKPNELWRIYNEMLHQVLSSEQPIKDLLDKAQQDANDVLGLTAR